MSRILNFLRSCPKLGECLIPDELKAYIRWWLTFLPLYNGISMIPDPDWSDPDDIIACDACLTGAGGWYQGQYFHATFPSYIQNLGMHIDGLEMLTLTVALKIWGWFLAGKKGDNAVRQLEHSSGHPNWEGQGPFSAGLPAGTGLLQARWECQVRTQHIRGVDNWLPNLLSIWDLDPKYGKEFFART